MRTKFEKLFWNIHSSVWDEYFYHPEYRKNMQSLLNCLVKKSEQKDERIIDLGCGTGNNSIALSQRGFSVLGIDFSPKMIEKAAEKINDKMSLKIDFQLTDLNESLPLSANSFDHAICIHVFQTLKNPVEFLAQLHKIVKPEGYFLLLVKNPKKRKESKIKLKKSLTRIIIFLLKKTLKITRKIRKYSKEDLQLLLSSSGFAVVKDCYFPGAIGLLAQKKIEKNRDV